MRVQPVVSAVGLMLFSCYTAAAATFEPFPRPYASMGTPLFHSFDTLYRYHDLEGMPPLLEHYRDTLQQAYDTGIRLEHEKHLDPSERMAYLAALRHVETVKKRLMHHLTLAAMRAIDSDDIATFNRLATLPLDELLPTFSTKDKAARFYLTRETVKTDALHRLSRQMTALRNERSRSSEPAHTVQKRRTYKLVTHLPGKTADEQKTDIALPESCRVPEENASAGFLEEVGRRCKALGINFDPSLMQKYRSHDMPSVKDFE